MDRICLHLQDFGHPAIAWTHNTNALLRKAHQRLHFLHVLWKNNLDQKSLLVFYQSSVDSVLFYLGVSYTGATSENRRAVQRGINTATGSSFHLRKTRAIIGDPFQPAHHLFDSLASGWHLRSMRSHTSRLTSSFFPWALGVEDVIMLQRNTFKSAFSTIQLLLSRETLKEMSLNMYLILWITVHMTDRLQHMRLGSALSDMTICSTVTPPGLCCLHSCLPCTPQTFNTVYRRTLMVLQRLDV